MADVGVRPALLALLAPAVQAPPAPSRILIRVVTIVSPERKAPLRHGYVVIEGDRIAAGGQGAPPRERWDSVVAGAGRVLIPGLIDGHTHLAMPAGMPVPVPAELRPLEGRYAEQRPRSYLYAGFTTVVDLAVFGRYGTVEPGKVAKLLLLRADPVKSVEPYDAIDLVVSRGRVLDRRSLTARE